MITCQIDGLHDEPFSLCYISHFFYFLNQNNLEAHLNILTLLGFKHICSFYDTVLIVCQDNISENVDHHCLNFLFIILLIFCDGGHLGIPINTYIITFEYISILSNGGHHLEWMLTVEYNLREVLSHSGFVSTECLFWLFDGV